MRTILNQCMMEIAKSGNIPFFLTGDIGSFSMQEFAQTYPGHFINVGVSEQNMIGIAAGLASQGKLVYVHSIDPFIVARAYEQIRVDIGINRLPVKIITVGDSLSYPKLGPTHSCPEGIALMRNILDMNIRIPCCKEQAKTMILSSAQWPRSEYFRLSSSNFNQYDGKDSWHTVPTYKGLIDKLIFTYGSLLQDCFDVCSQNNIPVELVNMCKTELWEDSWLLNILINKVKRNNIHDIYIFEESFSSGGLGEVISTLLLENNLNNIDMGCEGEMHRRIHRLYIKDHIQGYGSIEDAKNSARIGKEDILKCLTKDM